MNTNGAHETHDGHNGHGPGLSRRDLNGTVNQATPGKPGGMDSPMRRAGGSTVNSNARTDDGRVVEMESVSEPPQRILVNNPALAPVIARATAEEHQLPKPLAEAGASRATTASDAATSYADNLVAGNDGLMDSWPGDMSRAGRWWWNARLYAGRLLADLRQGRLRLPATFQPRIVLGLLIGLGLVVVVTAAGTLIATQLAGGIKLPNIGVGPAAQPTTGIVLQTNQRDSAPTVAVAPYLVAAWASNSAPPSSGTVQIYVRVTNSTTFAPQPGASVGLSIAFTCATPGNVQGYGPSATDADGIATFNVTFSNLPVGQPVCITARASVGGQTYAATATFAASGGFIVPTTTPGYPFPFPTPTPRPKKPRG